MGLFNSGFRQGQSAGLANGVISGFSAGKVKNILDRRCAFLGWKCGDLCRGGVLDGGGDFMID